MTYVRSWRSAIVCVAMGTFVSVGPPRSQSLVTDRGELAEARRAIGIGSTGPQVTSLIERGVVRSGFNGVTGELLPPRRLEIRMWFPDRFVQIDDDGRVTRRIGFYRGALIGQWTADSSDVHISHRGRLGDLDGLRRRFAYLTLGMVAQGTYLTLQKISRFTLFFLDESSRSVSLELDANSKLPMRLRYSDTFVFPKPLSRDELKRGVPPPPPPEQADAILSFADRRQSSGLLLPYHIVIAARGRVVEDIQFQQILVNPTLKESDFVP